jgi:hypothetical protein
MELIEIYLETRPEHIAYIKFIFESYEEVGIVRTVDRQKSVIVLLVMPDFVSVARKIIESLEAEIPLFETPRPSQLSDDWLLLDLARTSESRSKVQRFKSSRW